jgi:hypothetical protein
MVQRIEIEPVTSFARVAKIIPKCDAIFFGVRRAHQLVQRLCVVVLPVPEPLKAREQRRAHHTTQPQYRTRET